MQSTSSQPVYSRSFHLILFLAGVLWILASGNIAARAAQGIATRLNLSVIDELLQQAFFLFLLLWGFSTIRWIGARNLTTNTPANSSVRAINALPKRPTMLQEWQRGAAIGWGMMLVALLPMALSGALHPEFSPALGNWGLALLSLAAIALSTLALEVAFRGFLFARLIAATGPVAATILLSLAYALISGYSPTATPVSVIVTFLLAVLFCIAYLRTHALWLGWGLHFAWTASMAILFGLPIAGNATYNDLIFTSVSGSDWLTGSTYGPEAAVFTIAVLIAAIPVLYRISRNYEWEYTHPPIISAGYPMDIAQPPAHAAIEAAAAPAPLVQILSTTSTTSSTLPIIDEHLRLDDPSSTPRD